MAVKVFTIPSRGFRVVSRVLAWSGDELSGVVAFAEERRRRVQDGEEGDNGGRLLVVVCAHRIPADLPFMSWMENHCCNVNTQALDQGVIYDLLVEVS